MSDQLGYQPPNQQPSPEDEMLMNAIDKAVNSIGGNRYDVYGSQPDIYSVYSDENKRIQNLAVQNSRDDNIVLGLDGQPEGYDALPDRSVLESILKGGDDITGGKRFSSHSIYRGSGSGEGLPFDLEGIMNPKTSARGAAGNLNPQGFTQKGNARRAFELADKETDEILRQNNADAAWATIPYFDEQSGKYYLKKVPLTENNVYALRGKLLSAYGPKQFQSTLWDSFATTLEEGLFIGTGDAVFNLGEIVADLTHEDDDNKWIDQYASAWRAVGAISRETPTTQGSSGLGNPEGLASGLGTMFAYMGGTAGIGKALFKTAGTAAKWGATMAGASQAAKVAINRGALATSHFTASMMMNGNEVYQIGKENGIDDDKLGLLSLASGAAMALVERKIGTNELMERLIGGKSDDLVRETARIVAKETGGEISEASLEAASPRIMSKLLETVKSMRRTTAKVGGGIKGSRFGSAMYNAIEEGQEEFVQSMISNNAQVLYNELFAPSDSKPGAGQFIDQDRFFQASHFEQALEEATLGALVGGVGGAFISRAKERPIMEDVINGRVEEMLSEIDQIKHTGQYSEAQAEQYKERVLALNEIWYRNRQNYGHLSSDHQTEALAMLAQEEMARADAQALELDLSENPNQDPAGREIKEKQLRHYRAQQKTYQQTLEDYRVERRGETSYNESTSPAVRTMRQNLRYRKNLAEELQQYYGGIRDILAADENTAEEAVKVFEDLTNQMEGQIKVSNRMLDKTNDPDWRDRFDERVEERINNSILAAHHATMPEGFRMVEMGETSEGLEVGPGEEITTEGVIPGQSFSNPASTPFNDGSTGSQAEGNSEPNKAQPEVYSDPNEDQQESNDPQPDSNSQSTGTDQDGNEVVVLSTDPENADNFLIRNKDQAESEEAVRSVPKSEITLTQAAPGLREIIPSPNIFRGLYVQYSRDNKEQRLKAFRNALADPDLMSKVSLYVTNRMSRANAGADDPVFEGSQGVFRSNPAKPVGVQPDRSNIDIIVQYDDGSGTPLWLGRLHNPDKYVGPDNMPVDFSSMSADEFYQWFSITFPGSNGMVDAFNKFRHNWNKLRTTRALINQWVEERYPEEIANDLPLDVILPANAVDLSLIGAFQNLEDAAMPALSDVKDATDANGNTVIFDKTLNSTITPHAAPLPAGTPNGPYRYYAYVDKGNGLAGWVGLLPKQLKGGALRSMISRLGKVQKRVWDLDPEVKISDPQFQQELEDQLGFFVALGKGSKRYIYFRAYYQGGKTFLVAEYHKQPNDPNPQRAAVPQITKTAELTRFLQELSGESQINYRTHVPVPKGDQLRTILALQQIDHAGGTQELQKFYQGTNLKSHFDLTTNEDIFVPVNLEVDLDQEQFSSALWKSVPIVFSSFRKKDKGNRQSTQYQGTLNYLKERDLQVGSYIVRNGKPMMVIAIHPDQSFDAQYLYESDRAPRKNERNIELDPSNPADKVVGRFPLVEYNNGYYLYNPITKEIITVSGPDATAAMEPIILDKVNNALGTSFSPSQGPTSAASSASGLERLNEEFNKLKDVPAEEGYERYRKLWREQAEFVKELTTGTPDPEAMKQFRKLYKEWKVIRRRMEDEWSLLQEGDEDDDDAPIRTLYNVVLVGSQSADLSNRIVRQVLYHVRRNGNPNNQRLTTLVNQQIEAYLSSIDTVDLEFSESDEALMQEQLRQMAEYETIGDLLDDLTVEGRQNRKLITQEVKAILGRLSSLGSDELAQSQLGEELDTEAFTQLMEEQHQEEESERNWDQHTSASGVAATMSADVRLFLSTLTESSIDAFGRLQRTVVDDRDAYTLIQRHLAGSDNPAEKLQELARSYRLANIIYQAVEESDPYFRHRFYKNFEVERISHFRSMEGRGSRNTFDAVSNIEADTIISVWKNKMDQKRSLFSSQAKKDEVVSDIRSIVSAMNLDRSEQMPSVEIHLSDSTFASVLLPDAITRVLERIGIELPPAYVQASLGMVEVPGYMERVQLLSATRLQELASKIEASPNVDSFHHVEYEFDGDAIKMVDPNIQALARGAFHFFDNGSDSTYRDAENKTRAAYIQPNHITTSMKRFKEILHRSLVRETLGWDAVVNQFPHLRFNWIANQIRNLPSKAQRELAINNLTIGFGNDIGERKNRQTVGRVYKNSNPETFTKVNLIQFEVDRVRRKRGGLSFAHYTPFIVSDKSSSYVVQGMVEEGMYNEEGRISDKAMDAIMDHVFAHEYYRIKEGKRKGRKGGQFAVFEFLNRDPEFIKAVEESGNLDAIRGRASQLIKEEFEKEIDKLFELTGAQNLKFNKNFSTSYLNQNYEGNARSFLTDFYINSFLNSVATAEMLVKDLATFKDIANFYERAAGENAAGVSRGQGTIRVAYVDDTVIELDQDRFGKGADSNVDDGQVYVTLSEKINQDSDFGDMSAAKIEAMEKYQRGEELSSAEKKLVDLVSDKTVYYDGARYVKSSKTTLSYQQVAYRDSSGNYKPLPGKEELFNILQWMERHQISQLIPISAAKLYNEETHKPKIDPAFFRREDFSASDLPDGVENVEQVVDLLDKQHERKQQPNDSKVRKGKDKIKLSTQLQELIDAEIESPQMEKVQRSARAKEAQVRKIELNLVNRLIAQTGEGAREVAEVIQQILRRSAAGEQISSFLAPTKKGFRVNLNLLSVVPKTMEMMMSMFKDGVLYSTVAGAKLTLVSPKGYQILRTKSGEVIDRETFLQDPQRYEQMLASGELVRDDLKIYRNDGEGGLEYAEIAMTRESLALTGYEPGDIIPPEMIRIMGVRIPLDSYHSMLPAKVVEFLPDEYGDVVIAPKEITYLSGSDFDVDSLYIARKATYLKDGKSVPYGRASSVRDKWEEYWNYWANHKIIKGVTRSRMNKRRVTIKDEQELKQIRRIARVLIAKMNERVTVADSLDDNTLSALQALKERMSPGNTQQTIELQRLQSAIETIDQALSGEVDTTEVELIEDEGMLVEEGNEQLIRNALKQGADLQQFEEYIDGMVRRADHLSAKVRAEKYNISSQAMEDYGLIGSITEFDPSIDVPPATLQNQLLDDYFKLLEAPELSEAMDSATSTDGMRDDAKIVSAMADRLDADNNIIESPFIGLGFLSHLSAFWSNITGKKNTGPSAAGNAVNGFLRRLQVSGLDPMKYGFTIDGESKTRFDEVLETDRTISIKAVKKLREMSKSVTDEGGNFEAGANFRDLRNEAERNLEEVSRRKFDSAGAVLNTNVDNRKLRLAPILNLNTSNTAIMLTGLGMGVGRTRMNLLLTQPAVREVTAKPGSMRSVLKHLLEQIGDQVSESELKGDVSINTADLLAALAVQDQTTFDKGYYLTQFKALMIYGKLKALNNHTFKISQVLGLKKGAGANVRNLNQMKRYAYELGLRNEKPSPDSFGDIPENQGENLGNLSAAFATDVRTNQLIDSVSEIEKVLSHHFISLMDSFKPYAEKIRTNLDLEAQRNPLSGRFETIDIESRFVNYLALQAWATQRKAAGKPHNYLHLWRRDPDNPGQTLASRIQEIQASDDSPLKDNALISALKITRNFDDYIELVEARGIRGLTPTQQREMMDGFSEIMEVDPSLAQDMVHYLIEYDGLSFSSKSFAKYLPDFAFDPISGILDNLQQSFFNNSINEVERMIGMSMDKAVKDFLSIAVQEKNTSQVLKSQGVPSKKIFPYLNSPTSFVEASIKDGDILFKFDKPRAVYTGHSPAGVDNSGKSKIISAPRYLSEQHVDDEGNLYNLLFELDMEQDGIMAGGLLYKKIQQYDARMKGSYHLSPDELKRRSTLGYSMLEEEINEMFEEEGGLAEFLKQQGYEPTDEAETDEGVEEQSVDDMLAMLRGEEQTPDENQDPDNIFESVVLPQDEESEVDELLSILAGGASEPGMVEQIRSEQSADPEIWSKLLDPSDRYGFLAKMVKDLGVTVKTGKASSANSPMHIRRDTRTIVIAPDVIEQKVQAGEMKLDQLPLYLAHEMIHGIFFAANPMTKQKVFAELRTIFDTIYSQQNLPRKVEQIIRQINREVAIDPDRIEELVTYAFTDKEFASWLSSIPATQATGKKGNLWTALRDIVMNFIQNRSSNTIDQSMMDELTQILDTVSINPAFVNPPKPPTPQGGDPQGGDPQSDPEEDPLPPLQKDIIPIPSHQAEQAFSGQELAMISSYGAMDYEPGGKYNAAQNVRLTDMIMEVSEMNNVLLYSQLPEDQRRRIAKGLGYTTLEEMNDDIARGRIKEYYGKEGDHMINFFRDQIPAQVIFTSRAETLTADEAQAWSAAEASAANSWDASIKSLLTSLQMELDQVRKSKVASQIFKTNRVARLNRMISTLQQTQDVLALLKLMYFDLNDAKNLFAYQLNDPDVLKAMDVDEMIQLLTVVRQFTDSYSVLEDMINSHRDEFVKMLSSVPVGKREEYHNLQKLEEMVQIRGEIERMLIDKAVPALAEKLAVFVPKEGIEELKEHYDKRREVLERDKQQIESSSKSDGWKRKRIAAINKEIAELQQKFNWTAADQKSIEQILKVYATDMNLFEFWLAPMHQSKDPALAMFAQRTHYELFQAQQRTVDVARGLDEVFQRYKQEYGEKWNMEKMFGELTELTKNSRSQGRDQLAFIQKYDEAAYYDAIRLEMVKLNDPAYLAARRKEMEPERLHQLNQVRALLRKSLALNNPTAVDLKFRQSLEEIIETLEQPVPDYVLRSRLYSQLMQKHRVSLEAHEIAQVISAKSQAVQDGSISREEFKEWAMQNMSLTAMVNHGIIHPTEYDMLNRDLDTNDNGVVYYKGDLTRPADRYLNPRWRELYNEADEPINVKGEFHQALTTAYLEAQAKLPPSTRPGYLLPAVYKETKDRMLEETPKKGFLAAMGSTFKDWLERMTTTRADDTDYAVVSAESNRGSLVPVYFTGYIKPEDASLDLYGSIARFIMMSEFYQGNSKIFEEGMLMDRILGKRKEQVSRTGQRMINGTAQRFGFKVFDLMKATPESYGSQERLRKFLEMTVLGENKKVEAHNRDKIVDNLILPFISFTSLGADPQKALANFNTQMAMQAIESTSARFVKPKNLAAGHTFFWKHLPDLYNDMDQLKKKSLLGQLMEVYDPLAGEFVTQFGRKVSGGKLKGIMSRDLFFSMMHFGELEGQTSLLLATMHATKVRRGKGTIRLIDAYELDENGALKLKDGVQWSDLDTFKLKQRVKEINQQYNGIYNRSDKPVIEQYSFGRLMQHFRKYLYQGLRKRYGRNYVNTSADAMMGGYHRTFFVRLYRDMVTYRKGLEAITAINSEYTPFEKQQAIRSMTELTMIALATMMFGVLSAMEEEEEQERGMAYYYLMYQLYRLQAEVSAYINPNDLRRVVMVPSVAVTTLSRAMKAMQFALPWNWDEEFERDSGMWDKGDSKSVAYTLRLFGITGNLTNPDQALNTLKNLENF